MEIYECRPGNMPEDIMLHKFTIVKRGLVFLARISDSYERIQKMCKPGFLEPHSKALRYVKSPTKRSWCGEHPRYWRELEPCEVKNVKLQK